MKALVVGYGSIGRRHIKNLSSIKNIEILVCSRSKKKNKLKKNIHFFSSLGECIKQKPDFAIISNVSNEHICTATILAKHNIDLLIEKPLSHNLKGVQNLLKIINKKNLVTLMGCNLRFHPCIKRIKELISEKKLGKILSVQAESGSYLPSWHLDEDYRKSYSARKDLGGDVTLTCIHELDYLYWFFRDVKEIFSLTGKFSSLQITSDDLSSIILRFKNNIIGEIHLDYFQRPDLRRCKIIGEKGTIYWDSQSNKVNLFSSKRKKWKTVTYARNYDRNKEYMDELKYFINCVKYRKKTFNPVSEGAKILEIALLAKKSSTKRKMLSI